MTVGNSEVRLGKNVSGSVCDESHLVVDSIILDELQEGSSVVATFSNFKNGKAYQQR